MTKTELEEKIKNSESVWCVYKDKSSIYEIKSVEIEKVLSDTFLWGKEYYANIKDIYKTKAEAEHYLHHANISRTETLPFLTWEEFLEKLQMIFTGKDKKEYCLFIEFNQVKIFNKSDFKYIFREDLTEANFYKAYDECVRLFKGE